MHHNIINITPSTNPYDKSCKSQAPVICHQQDTDSHQEIILFIEPFEVQFSSFWCIFFLASTTKISQNRRDIYFNKSRIHTSQNQYLALSITYVRDIFMCTCINVLSELVFTDFQRFYVSSFFIVTLTFQHADFLSSIKVIYLEIIRIDKESKCTSIWRVTGH